MRVSIIRPEADGRCKLHTGLRGREPPRLHLTDAFNMGQGFGLAVVADFDYGGGDKGYGAHRGCNRERDVAVRSRHVGMQSAHPRSDHDPYDS